MQTPGYYIEKGIPNGTAKVIGPFITDDEASEYAANRWYHPINAGGVNRSLRYTVNYYTFEQPKL